MNIHKPTGKKVSSWPQMVEDLKRRCCDLWKDVMEAQAKNDS